MRNDGIITAIVVCGLSFGLLCASLGALYPNPEKRLDLTYAETFADLAGIRDVFLATRNYTVLHNPPRVDHVQFPGVPELPEDLEDLQRRGLFPGVVWNASSLQTNSLLHRLLRASWCSSGVARTDLLPARRNPGCRCISDAYLALIQETLPANASNYTLNGSVLATVNVSADSGRRAGDRVFRCWDQRQVTRTRHCGNFCTTHVAGMALFANIVLFLTCMAYIAFRISGWNLFLTKGFVVALGLALSAAYLARDIEANALTLGGLGVCLFSLTFTLHDELALDEARDGPHPLFTSLLVNLPLIISAHAIQIGVSGYGRDMWVLASFGFCGGLLGTVAQRYFWHSWYGLVLEEGKALQFSVCRVALGVAYVALQILLLLLSVAYYYPDSPYSGGGAFVLILYEWFLVCLLWFINTDYTAMLERGAVLMTDELTFIQKGVLFQVLIANAVMTIVAIVDVL